MTSIKTQRIYKKPRRLTKKCHFNRNPDLVTTLSLNVDSSKTFKKQEEAKSDVKIVESIVVSPKLFNIMSPWDIPDYTIRSGINVQSGRFGKNNKRTVWNKRTGGKISL